MTWFRCTWVDRCETYVRMVAVAEGRIAGSDIAYPFGFGREWKEASAFALRMGWTIERLEPAEE